MTPPGFNLAYGTKGHLAVRSHPKREGEWRKPVIIIPCDQHSKPLTETLFVLSEPALSLLSLISQIFVQCDPSRVKKSFPSK
ncbi:hypothetical protein CEXT_57291 [Caerostris extrusa]|uniref:Uncharacterized protein n=1 Tax=Caerostris extrusa TaxID=172846 RepID=A0AAV4SSW2_CAEEX|nr:hypothetical protein CEXT_57291 [Caerostris extrusa]